MVKKRSRILACIGFIVGTLSFEIFSDPSATDSREMTLHDFMEDYTEIAMKKSKKGDPKYLERVLREIPNFAIAENKEKWSEISKKALETRKFGSSCKACHKEFKKAYKKQYKKRMITVPGDIIQLFHSLKK